LGLGAAIALRMAMTGLLALLAASVLLAAETRSPPVSVRNEVPAFRGSTERALLEARGRVRRGEHLLRRHRFREATAALMTGCTGLEDSFDRLSGIDEIVGCYLSLLRAELGVGHHVEALQAAEIIAVLGHVDGFRGTTRALRDVLAAARRRVDTGPRGFLRVTSTVEGQPFEVDGAPRGMTPADLELPAGRHYAMVETPLGQIPYRIDLHAGEGLQVGQSEPGAIFPDPLGDEGLEGTEGNAAGRAARRPVLPHRR
jgi:hypothetical protein